MASFTSSGVSNATPNLLANIPGAMLAGQQLQQNALAIQGGQQALTDRQTFRDSAAGLLSRDPTQTAAAMGADPSATTSYLGTTPALDQNTRVQSAADQAALGSAAGALLNAAPGQRQALWTQARQQLIAGGHTNIPGPDYPGDTAMLAAHNSALTADQQFGLQSQNLSPTPQSPMMAIPGGASPPSVSGAGASPAPSGGGADPAMAQRESGGNAAVMSPLGYAGKYQMGTAALTDAGVYQPAQGENLKTNNWQGTFNIPGFPQVKTLADYRASPDAQDAAYGAHVDAIDKAIAATPGAQNFDQSGLIAVAHLGGVTGMRQFVASGGQHNPADPNGTSLQDYYRAFSGHHPGGLITAIGQGGVAGVKDTVLSGAKYGPPDPNGNPTVQLASNQGAAGMQPTPTDAPAGVLPAQASPQPQTSDQPASTVETGFNKMLSGIYAPAAPLGPGQAPFPTVQPDPTQPSDATTQPGGGQVQPDTGGGSFPHSIASDNGPRNALASAVPSTTQNALAGLTASPAPGGLLPPGAPAHSAPNLLAATGTPSPSATPQFSMPAGAGVAQSDAGKTPLFQGNSYVPAPNLPGYILALDANKQRTIMRIPGAPPPKPPETKFIGGTMVQTDGTTGEVIRVVPNMVPDPSRMAQVTGAGPNGQNGTTLFQDGKPAGFVPASTQPIQMAAYQADLGRAGQVAQQATDAEQQVQRALEARNYANGLPTGAGGEDRAALSTWMKTYAPESVYQGFVKSGYLPDAPQAEAAAKVMLGQAALDEKTMGGSGGLGLTEKYAKANPSLNMTPQAIQSMSNLKAVTAQSAKDYAQGYLQHFNQQARNFTQAGGSYEPASNFDEAWHAQPNVQTYMGAIDAMNGAPYAKWSQGLSPDVQQRAIDVIARVDPTSTINGKNGRIAVVGRAAAPPAPAVGTVQAGYRYNGGDPSSPASWARPH